MADIKSSIATPVAEPVTIDNLDPAYPRLTVGLSFFDDAALTIPSASPAGSFAVEGIVQGGQTYTAFANSPVDVSVDGAFASAASPIETVRVTPSGVSGTSYYQVTITANRS